MKLTIKLFIILFFTILQGSSQNLFLLDSLAEEIIETYNIKGIAMVGVKDGQTIYSRGFGKANEQYGITENTPIYIASNTKAFVGLAMLKLINEKKIDADLPITDFIDRSYFPEEIAVDSIMVRDLLSHNTGISNDPLTFRTSSSGEFPDDIQELLNHTVYRNDSTSLVKSFSYSNLGYLLCGIIIENITGSNWKEYLEDEIFPLLNMKDTHPNIPTGIKGDLMALPYIFNKDKPLQLVKEDNTLHAAGGLITNLTDMGNWLGFYTGSSPNSDGIKNKELKNYNDTLIVADDSFGPIKINGYGYGWYKGNILGLPINFHAGGFSGHNSFMSYLPDENVGFFIYMNENSNLRLAALQLTFQFYHLLTKNENLEKTFPIFKKRVQSVYENYKSENLTPINPKENQLPTGAYFNTKYGTMSITDYGDRYEMTLGLNLRSIIYKGKNENDIIVEFIPEESVNFRIEGTGLELKIKYGKDYGYFIPIENN